MTKTDQKLLNELRQTKGFSENFAESLQGGFLILSAKGKIIVVKSLLCRIIGFDKEELIDAKLPFPF